MAKIIIFEDHGQDFLRWTVDDDGFVIDSDLQDHVWTGTLVLNIDILKKNQKPIVVFKSEIGRVILALAKKDRKNAERFIRLMNYPVASIEKSPSEHTVTVKTYFR